MSSNINYNLSGKYGIGKEVILSKEDFDRLNGKSLCCLASGYIMIWDKKAKYFHRWLLNLDTDDKQVVDHIDGNKLNCTRENLRLCSTSENMANRKGAGKSKYRGVTIRDNRWYANCKKNKINYYLGSFETEKEAAEAYNTKAKELHQHFALLNIVI